MFLQEKLLVFLYSLQKFFFREKYHKKKIMLNTFASLKCSKKCEHTVFSRLNAPGVCLKIGSFDTAFNQGPA